MSASARPGGGRKPLPCAEHATALVYAAQIDLRNLRNSSRVYASDGLSTVVILP